MERLSLFDQLFHKISGSDIPSLNMQGAMVVDPAKGVNDFTPAELAEHIAARLSDFPVLRKKVVQDRLRIGDLKLVDDPQFDIRDHITFRTLPSPGDAEALGRAIGEFSAQDLDTTKPLWRIEIVDGLAGGKIAILQKLSHAIMDGDAAIKVFQCLFDARPLRLDKFREFPWQPDPEPGSLELIRSALVENATRATVHAPRAVRQLSGMLANTARDALGRGFGTRAEPPLSGNETALFRAPRTSLNRGISHESRNVAFANYNLDELKALSKALGCTLNDLCLVMVSESLTSYFASIGEEIEGDLVIAMPLSTRAAGERSQGNALSVSLIDAKNSISSLPERLRAIQAQTGAAKTGRSEAAKTKQTKSSNEIVEAISPLMLDVLIGLLSLTRAWDRLPPAMTTVMSNVAGPREGMFFAGMPLECSIPMIPMTHGGGLSIGATSMGNIFSFGYHMCGKTVLPENAHYFIEGLERAYKELSAVAMPQGKSTSVVSRKKPARKGTRRPGAKKSPEEKQPLEIKPIRGSANRGRSPGGSSRGKP
jgi:WS/DGAT/MGAT family acyltransferase